MSKYYFNDQSGIEKIRHANSIVENEIAVGQRLIIPLDE
ncbi:hypothetical protein ACI2OX_10455 [Bacillus sp. N9]